MLLMNCYIKNQFYLNQKVISEKVVYQSKRDAWKMGGPDTGDLCAVVPDSAPPKALCSFGLHRLGREGSPGVRAAQSGTSIVNRSVISAPLHHY